MTPEVSVVVVHYGPAALLAACLESIAKHAPEAETLVVWNGRRAGEEADLDAAFADVRFFRNEENRGFSAAVNQGMAAARGRLALLLNGDARLTAGALERLASAARGERVAAVGAQLVGADGRRRASWSGLPTPARMALLPRRLRERLEGRLAERGVHAVPGLVGAAMLVSREAWEAVGPFDERYFVYFVETDWCLRAARAGLRILLDREAEVLHEGGASSRDRKERADREYEFARLQYVEKFWGAAARRRFATVRLARAWVNARANALAAAILRPADPDRAGRLAARARAYEADLAWRRAGCPGAAGIAPIERFARRSL